jgi:hypothetical protein
MSVVCEDFKNLLTSYSNTITNNNLLFRISKKCGFSQLVTVPCNKSYKNMNQPTIYSLLESIYTQMGEWTINKVYYYTKRDNLMSLEYEPEENKIYLHQQDIFTQLVPFSVSNFQTAYSVNECPFAVYQLYIETDCDHACIEKIYDSQKEYNMNSFHNDLDYVV